MTVKENNFLIKMKNFKNKIKKILFNAYAFIPTKKIIFYLSHYFFVFKINFFRMHGFMLHAKKKVYLTIKKNKLKVVQ